MTKFDEFYEVIRKLRAPDGCPWDRAQTHESLKPPCIEEACEVICGINVLKETGNADNLKEELGDLLLQVIFHAQIAEDAGEFTMDDVLQTAIDKMVRRHPHVFAGKVYRDQAEAKADWDEIKRREKAGRPSNDEALREAFDESIEWIHVAKRRKHMEED